MATYAFQNTWHIIVLIGALAAVRAGIAHLRAMPHRAGIIEFIDSALIAALLVFCILRPFVIQTSFIPSGSMEPTLQEDDRILVNKFLYLFKDPKAGDVIVFDAPPQALQGSPRTDFVKRVVGVPGDRICVRDNRLFRNGAPVGEPYVKDAPLYSWPPDADEGNEAVVPDGYLLVFGDNRNDSFDSHLWALPRLDGTLRPAPFLIRESVRGKAVAIFWPPSRVGLIE